MLPELTQLPRIALLGIGLGLLLVGYILGEVIQMLEDGLLLLVIRALGFLVIGFYFLKIFFQLDPL